MEVWPDSFRKSIFPLKALLETPFAAREERDQIDIQLDDFEEQYDPAFDPSFCHGIETDDPLPDDASELGPIPSQLSSPKAHAHPPDSDDSVSSTALMSLNKERMADAASNPKFESTALRIASLKPQIGS